MKPLREGLQNFRKLFVQDKPLVAPEPAYGKPRQMTGFLATLSPENQKKALEYTGPDNFGPVEAKKA